MYDYNFNEFNSVPLSGARIWLSGAVPEDKDTTEQQRIAILDFVRQFSRHVFERGGHIVHGSHPSFTPILIEESKRYQEQSGKKDALMLFVSHFWSKHLNIDTINKWRETALVYEIPEAKDDHDRDNSLVQLRKNLVAVCDAVVVIGGKWWQAVAGRSGVPIELGLAMQRGLPCFLLGGFSGAAQDFLKGNPNILTQLKNGLDDAANCRLSTEENVGRVVEDVCAQLERLPLVRGRGSDGPSFRILALDGGGIKGAFTAAALATWEEQTHLRIVDHFDLIAGTSTGGILAIGLGLGLSGQQMLDFYKKKGPIIFPVTRLRRKLLHIARHLCLPKYSQRVLLKELEKAYCPNGETKYLKDSCCRLLIPTYRAVAGTSHVFRTPHHPDLTADANTLATHVALATAAAPTFFAAAKIATMVTESSYFDGGVWANSPAMAAVIEATCFLHIPLERIDVLSVGTTEEPFTVKEQTKAGIIGWLWKKKILDLLMNVQQESSLKLTKNLVNDSCFLRVNTMTPPGSYSLDSPKEILALADLGQDVALKKEFLGPVKSRFLNGVRVQHWDKYV